MDISMFLPLVLVGCVAGFMAGLLGVGGGLIIVPVFVWWMNSHGLGGVYTQHVAVGSSLAIMVCTSFSSVVAQQKQGSVRWDIFKKLGPAIVVGTLLGAQVAAYIPGRQLQWFFVVFVFMVGIKTFLGRKTGGSRELPGWLGSGLVGSIIGVVSSWIGIGGSTMTIPFMTWCKVPIRQAIGTSSLLGWPIAFFGALGYMVSGQGEVNLPGMVGFVYFPGVIAVALTTVLFAPLGVKVAHRISPKQLKIIFSLLLIAVSGQMLYSLLTHPVG